MSRITIHTSTLALTNQHVVVEIGNVGEKESLLYRQYKIITMFPFSYGHMEKSVGLFPSI